MSTLRSGYVRTTSTDVYKGESARVTPSWNERYTEKKQYNGLVLIVGLLLVSGLAYFILTHI